MTTSANDDESPSEHPDDNDRVDLPSNGGNDEVHHSLPSIDSIVKDPPSSDDWPARLSTAAGVAGNMMEWYDFAIFGYFSDTIAELFFPEQSGNNALVESFLVFGTGFLMRPIGGMALGYIGDKFGRKTSLEHSIFIMAFSTFLMGCLPTYDQIGYASTVLLVLVRLMQGASVGGQLMSSMVFTLERHPKERWGYYGAVVMSTATLGTLFGGIIAYIVRESLSSEDLIAWGWRIPFFLGCIVIVPGLYLKYKTTDHHHLTEDEDNIASAEFNPIKEMVNPIYRRAFISCSMIVAVGAGGFYLAYVWLAIFMETILEPPIEHAFAINTISLAQGALAFYPFCGYISDRIGRMKVMLVGGIMLIFVGPITISLVNVGQSGTAWLGQTLMGIALSLFGAPSNAWIVENFPPKVRLTALSVAYNLTTGIIGGFTPAVATLLVDHVSLISPGFILSFLAIISLVGLYISPREGGNSGTPASSIHNPSSDTANVQNGEVV